MENTQVGAGWRGEHIKQVACNFVHICEIRLVLICMGVSPPLDGLLSRDDHPKLFASRVQVYSTDSPIKCNSDSYIFLSH